MNGPHHYVLSREILFAMLNAQEGRARAISIVLQYIMLIHNFTEDFV
jgi:hypothetical protein